MFEDSDSFWEDGQRLTDSWYGIKKVPGEPVPNDDKSDSFREDGQRFTDSWYGIKKVPGESVPDDDNDDMCVQGLLNVENSKLNYVEGIQ